MRAGDVVVFRPGAVHGIDNGPDSRMYCLELMVPNEVGTKVIGWAGDCLVCTAWS